MQARRFSLGLAKNGRHDSNAEGNIMAIKLPRIINDYVNASNAHDAKSILSCFSDDAVVRDEGERLYGTKTIEE
jgi:ketosteroid isomerase-like protein